MRLSVLAICCIPLISLSQHNISGRITDGQKGLPSATVVLLSVADSTMVKGKPADTEGYFALEQVERGSYKLVVSMVGYSDFTSPVIEVAGQDIVISPVILTEVATELGEVVVTAETPVIEQQHDRLVVNVQNSITAAGNTVLEILQKSPGVTVNRQNSTIGMNGRTGVRIMVNGKPLQLPADAAVQMLDGMNASGIEKIELISQPPAKYDAEGNAGVINIVTKESREYGTNASIGLLLGRKWAEATGVSFNVNHRSERSVWFIDYGMTRTRSRHIMKMDAQWFDDGYAHTNENSSYRPNLTHQQNLTGGLDIRLSEKVSLNLLLSAYRRNWTLNATTSDRVHVGQDSTVFTMMNIHEKNRWQSATGSIGLTIKPAGRSETDVNADYLYYHNDNPSSYNTSTQVEQKSPIAHSDILLTKDTPIRMLVGRIDHRYAHSPSLHLEAGVKAVHSSLNNTVVTRRVENNTSVTDSAFSSDSKLSEAIAAAYLSATWKVAAATTIISGLRYEYTHTAIHSSARDALIDRRYGYWFPNFSIIVDAAPERSMQLSYARRITRPTYNDIAPFVFFWGPNTFSAGNTSLWPAVSDAVKAAYQNRRWTVALQYSRTKREIINLFQPERDTVNNSVVFRSQNLSYLSTLSLTSTWSLKPAPWWEVDATVTAQYQVARTEHLPHNLRVRLPGANLNVASIMQLGKGYSIEISGFVQSTSFYGVSTFLPQGSLNAGIQKKFSRGSIKISMDDILYTNVWRIRTFSVQNGLDSRIRYDWNNQFLRVACTFNLGQPQLRSVKIKSGSAEEQERVTN